MLRCIARLLLTLVAVLALMPGADDVVEQVVELVGHGHPAHSVPGEADPLADEHGCAPVDHHCTCHTGQSVAELAWGRASLDQGVGMTWMLGGARRSRMVAPEHSSAGALLAPRNRANAPPTPPPNA